MEWVFNGKLCYVGVLVFDVDGDVLWFCKCGVY